MTKKNDRVTLEEHRRWMQRRDAHLVHIGSDTFSGAPPDDHADVAVLEEWLQGNISDDSVAEYMNSHKACDRCEEVYESYKALKASKTLGNQ